MTLRALQVPVHAGDADVAFAGPAPELPLRFLAAVHDLPAGATPPISLLAGNSRYGDSRIKRGLDIAISLSLLVALSWLMLLLAAITRLSGGPALYCHQRLGRHGREFTCYKFRTMGADADSALRQLLADDPAAAAEWRRDFKLRHDPRVTVIGRWLRRSSLDELPQLWNVLRGDMSLIGPRPIVAAELARYGRFARYYLQGRPGITGLWQVSGRGDTGYARRVALDVLYARTWSLRSDLVVLLGTVRAVFSRRGAY